LDEFLVYKLKYKMKPISIKYHQLNVRHCVKLRRAYTANQSKFTETN
jgi:hypothetical protein